MRSIFRVICIFIFVVVVCGITLFILLNNSETQNEVVYKDVSSETLDAIRNSYSDTNVVTIKDEISDQSPTIDQKVGITDVHLESGIQNKRDTTISTIAKDKPVKVSPHGFGPYPELPDKWPSDYWDKPMTREHELIGRVRIKLYTDEGKWAEGITIDHTTGMVHPIYKDTVYVRWGSFTGMDGKTHRYISSSKGHPDTLKRIGQYQHPVTISKLISKIKNGDNISFENMQVSENDLPSDINFISYEDGTIDPMLYLGLK